MKKLLKALGVLLAAVAMLSFTTPYTSAEDQNQKLLEFDDFVCPGPCPAGMNPCCYYAPPFP